MTKKLDIIGQAVRMSVGQTPGIPAKVDSGADLSSIWATDVREAGGRLEFVLFGKDSSYYTGEIISVPAADFRLVWIANSFGGRQKRYVAKLSVTVNGRRIKAAFSLADRQNKTYPILIGRRLLHSKFLVDVSIANEALTSEERQKIRALRLALSKRKT